MNDQLKEYRHQINGIFGTVKHTVHIFRIKKNILFDIEYEDFKNESHIEEEVRKIVGEDNLINVKRYCSERMMAAIRKNRGPFPNERLLHDEMAEYEDSSLMESSRHTKEKLLS